MGTSLIATTIINLLLNIGVISLNTVSISVRKLKLKYLAWKQAQEIKAAKEHQIWMAKC